MSNRLPPLNALRTFEVAARHLSFKKAAEELNVTPTAVSHQIQQLEDFLGIQLFQRLNRGLELTRAAQSCLPGLQECFEGLQQSVEKLHKYKRADTLTIGAPPSFATRWLMPRLHRFVMKHPEIDVQVSTRIRNHGQQPKKRDREVDSVLAWSDETDVLIVFGRGNYPDLCVDKLVPLAITPMCSPLLLEGDAPLQTHQDLCRYLLLHDDRGALYEGKPFWKVWLEAAGVQEVDPERGHHFTHSILALEAAVEGLGVAISTPALAAADLQTGRLVAPFPLIVPLASAYYVVSNTQSGRHDMIKLFRNWLLEEATAEKALASIAAN